MGIELSTQLIHASIAQVLHEIVPEAEIFDNPNQQGTPYPAWFIVHRSPVEIRREIRRYYITYYIDVWYMIQQNITQMFDKYTAVAEQLADKMEYIPLYGYPGVVLHTFETSWSLEMTAMKYSLTIRLVCSRDGAVMPKMEVIEDFQTFIKGLGKLKRIRYICSQFPDFDMGLETLQYCTEGNTLVLPFVSGIYRDGDNTRWEPLTWNVGAFGSQYGPVTEDVTINLEMGVVVGFDVVVGGTVGVGANVGRDIVWRITDMSKDGWHYVGPEHSLATELAVGGSDLSRDEYEPIGPQKNLGPSPVYGGTVEPYDPTPILPTVTLPNYAFVYRGSDSSTATLSSGAGFNAKDTSGNSILYDESLSYAVFLYYPSRIGDGILWDGFTASNNSGQLKITNSSSSTVTVHRVLYATCSDSSATVVKVYDSSNNSYNAFRYTTNDVDYYYVLDDVQTDWTNNLSSIGYSVTPAITKGYFSERKLPATITGSWSGVLYNESGQMTRYNDSKSYSLYALIGTNGNPISVTLSSFPLYKDGSYLGFRNNSGQTVYSIAYVAYTVS